ncbi:triose-phosphate isomerase [Parafrigoribacterium mesophilum]|uniref:triose-phosphate isomerase family protein n=1 Tax=Parafrigoribacterium mesophilum TaxID=433646 RepID=UPI0031FBB01B
MTAPAPARTRYLIGVSLKMYFSHARTVEWCRAVAEIARAHPAVAREEAELFVIPGYLSVPAARQALGDDVAVGAQDLSVEDVGAFTGEVSGATIAELGCSVVEVGHAERRRLYGETDDIVRAKVAAAIRNGLTPVLCIGEATQGTAEEAIRQCIRQFDDATCTVRGAGDFGRIIVAYEPLWAIGAVQPATPDYIRAVCGPLRNHLIRQTDAAHSALIYGGSAGPGLLTEIGDTVDGIFLGRFAHDPAAVAQILDEVHALAASTAAR